MIIGLCGLKHSGKDTVAAYLVKERGYERRAFADPLKKSVANLLGISFSDIDKFKNDDNIEVVLTGFGGVVVLTFREFLQRYGTEAHRDVEEMGTDFWVDLSLPVPGFYTGRDIVISDVRFKSEAKRIKYLNGMIVEVNRAGLTSKDQHRSEQEFKELHIDYTVFNNGSIDDLNVGIEVMLKNVYQMAAY